MQIYSTNARFYSKNTLFCPLKCVFTSKRTKEETSDKAICFSAGCLSWAVSGKKHPLVTRLIVCLTAL